MEPQKKRRVLRPTKQEVGNVKRELGVQIPTNTNISKFVREGWERAALASESEIAAYIPTETALQVGEGFLAGQRSIDSLTKFSGKPREEIKAVLMDPIAMAWISRQVYYLFQHRTAIIDAQLYQRAAAGDLQAIKMFYERMDKLPTNKKEINVNYSGGVDVRQVSDEELKAIIQEKKRLLPAEFRIIHEEKEDNVAETESQGS